MVLYSRCGRSFVVFIELALPEKHGGFVGGEDLVAHPLADAGFDQAPTLLLNHLTSRSIFSDCQPYAYLAHLRIEPKISDPGLGRSTAV